MGFMINKYVSSEMPNKVVNMVVGNPSTSKTIGMSAKEGSRFVPKFVSDTYDKGVDGLAKGIGKFAGIKYVKGVTEWCVKHNIDYTNHLSAMCANVLNGFYMYNVATSKKIEPEQKKPLMLNMFIGTVLSTIGGYALNGIIDKKLKPFDTAIRQQYADKAKQYAGKAKQYDDKASKILGGFRIAKSLMVFQLLYRFVCPVVATPIANHISNRLRDKKEGEKGSLSV